MNDDQLKVIEERAAKASPGPWDDFGTCSRCDELHLTALREGWCDGTHATDADMVFLRAAREDIPALVAEVRRLREWQARAADCLLRIRDRGVSSVGYHEVDPLLVEAGMRPPPWLPLP